MDSDLTNGRNGRPRTPLSRPLMFWFHRQRSAALRLSAPRDLGCACVRCPRELGCKGAMGADPGLCGAAQPLVPVRTRLPVQTPASTATLAGVPALAGETRGSTGFRGSGLLFDMSFCTREMASLWCQKRRRRRSDTKQPHSDTKNNGHKNATTTTTTPDKNAFFLHGHSRRDHRYFGAANRRRFSKELGGGYHGAIPRPQPQLRTGWRARACVGGVRAVRPWAGGRG